MTSKQGFVATDCAYRGSAREVTHVANNSTVVVFDDQRAGASAGVMLLALLAGSRGIEQLVDAHVDLRPLGRRESGPHGDPGTYRLTQTVGTSVKTLSFTITKRDLAA